jgi:hypothetical protein
VNQPSSPLRARHCHQRPDIDDGDALYLLMVVFYEPGMIFESRNILPTIESGSINQQSDLIHKRDFARRWRCAWATKDIRPELRGGMSGFG